MTPVNIPPVPNATLAGDPAQESSIHPASKAGLSELKPEQNGENRPRKILYVTATLPYGVGESFLIPEVKELLRRGCDVRLVPRWPTREVVHGDAAELLEHTEATSLLSWDVVVASVKEILLRPRGAFRALTAVLGKGDWKTQIKNLLVYPKGLWLGGLARRWQADQIHVHWLSTPATIGMIAGIVSQTPWSCTAHRSDICLNNLLVVKLGHARFVRFISRSGLQMAASLGAKVDSRKSAVIHVGVNIPAQDGTVSAAASGATVLCPANLIPVKGHKYLIDAIGILRKRAVDCSLLVAGQGKLRQELEARAQALGLGERIRFLGQCSHTEILDMYERSRISMVVLPSVDLGNHLHEGIPVALMEAMSYAVPVVSTQTGGIPELLEGGAGLLVPDKDPAALADAMERLAKDPLLRAEVGRKGRQRVCESFNVEVVVTSLLNHIATPPVLRDGPAEKGLAVFDGTVRG